MGSDAYEPASGANGGAPSASADPVRLGRGDPAAIEAEEPPSSRTTGRTLPRESRHIKSSGRVVRVGGTAFDLDTGVISAGGRRATLSPVGRLVLGALVDAGGQPVSTAVLLSVAWPSGRGYVKNLRTAISGLRKTLASYARGVDIQAAGGAYRLTSPR